MTRPISDLDVPLTVLRQQIRALIARQRADASATRLRAFLAPTTPNTTHQEAK
ncbi:hypothetical protein ACFWPQ_02110 [Streptomyces sp. NPDC058464]|uniref:hypothetical protein n=1 Tax=Streptomyces sp. NPDC058464 TaxID=3346511 RepID=UPI003649CC44